MIRKAKKYSWPRKLYDKKRIVDENQLVETYGLKNKREIWKIDAKIKYFRNRAKDLITADTGKQQNFFDKLNTIGLRVKTVADVLALNKEDLMERRLATLVWKKGLATTAQQARQLIVHKKVVVDGRVMNVPGYLVQVDEEENISVRQKAKKLKAEAPMQEVTENVQ